jgi:hypothetical protein
VMSDQFIIGGSVNTGETVVSDEVSGKPIDWTILPGEFVIGGAGSVASGALGDATALGQSVKSVSIVGVDGATAGAQSINDQMIPNNRHFSLTQFFEDTVQGTVIGGTADVSQSVYKSQIEKGLTFNIGGKSTTFEPVFGATIQLGESAVPKLSEILSQVQAQSQQTSHLEVATKN